MTTPTTTQTPVGDDFDAVFDQITKLDDKGKEPDVATPAVVVPPVAQAVTAPAVAEPPPADAPQTTEVGEPPAATPQTEAPPSEADLAAQRIAELEAELATAKKTSAAAPAETAGGAEQAAPAAEVAPPAIEWYKFSPEETAMLTEHAKEWPDIAKAEEIRTKAAVFNAMQYVFAEITSKYGPVLDRFKLTADAMEETLALNEIRGAHQDYDSVRDKVVGWVDTLPVAFKAGAQAILKTGTPEEVSSLIAEFKKQTGTTPAAVATPAKTELSVAAKKAAGNLSVVDSKRTSVPAAGPDKNDFEGAWNEASGTG